MNNKQYVFLCEKLENVTIFNLSLVSHFKYVIKRRAAAS
jgi:hypothetical protein